MDAPRNNGGLNRRRGFLIGIELAEKVATFMIGTCLIEYLMETQQYGLKKATEITNYWGGATRIALLIGAIVAQAFTGRRITIIMVCSFAYIVGLSILTAAEFVPALKPCLEPTCPDRNKTHTKTFFFSICIIAIVSGGMKSSLDSVVNNQFDNDHNHIKTWWKVGTSILNFLFSLGITYSFEIWDWGVTNVGLFFIMTVGIGIFYLGKTSYRVRIPTHENPNLPPEINLCMLFLLWITCIVFGISHAQIFTFFAEQSTCMNRTVNGTELPPLLFVCLSTVGVQPIVFLLEKFVVPILGTTNREQGHINMLKRAQIGIILTLIGMMIGGIVERKRITSLITLDINCPIDLSAFWLLPQGILFAITEGLMLNGIGEYFEEYMPHLTSSLASGFCMSAIGIGNFFNILLIKIVDHITKKTGRSWFGEELDSSRVDKFYWLLFGIFLLYLIIFRFFAAQIRIRGLQR